MPMILKLMRLQSHSHPQFPTNPIYKGDTIQVDDELAQTLLGKGLNVGTGEDVEFRSYYDKCPANTPPRYIANSRAVPAASDPNIVTLTKADYEALMQAANASKKPQIEDAGGEDGDGEGDGGDGDGESGVTDAPAAAPAPAPAPASAPKPRQRAAAKSARQ